MSNAIIARLGLDSSNFAKGLSQSTAATEAANSRLTASVKARQKATESLLERDQKVENQLVGLANKLTAVQSVGDAVSATFTALAESINLSLGAAVGAGVGIAIAQGLNKAADAAAKVRDNLSDAIATGQKLDSVDGITNLHSSLSGIAAALKEVNKPLSTMQFFAEGLDDMGASSRGETGEGKREKLRADAIGQVKRLMSELAGAHGEIALIQERILKGDEVGAQLARSRLDSAQKLKEFQRFAESVGADPGDVAAVEMMMRKQQEFTERKIQEDDKARKLRDIEEEKQAQLKADRECAEADEKFTDDQRKHEEEMAENGRGTELQMAGEAKEFLDRKAKKEKDSADAKAKAEQKLFDDAKKFSEDAEKTDAEKHKARVDAKLEDIRDPGGKSRRKREARKQDSLRRRAEREIGLEDRGGRSTIDIAAGINKGDTSRNSGTDFIKALDGAQVLKKIQQNTSMLGVNL